MEISLSFQNIQELCHTVGNSLGAAYQQDQNEQIWQLPPKLAEGVVRRFELRPGLELLLHNHINREPIRILADYQMQPMFSCDFWLAGQEQITMHRCNEDFIFGAGQSRLAFVPSFSGIAAQPKGQITLITINITPETLSNFVDESFGEIPLQLRQILRGKYPKKYFQPAQMSSTMLVAANQAFSCPYRGASRRLYLEGKALELIAGYLEQLSIDIKEINNSNVIKSGDVERIYQAREILFKNLETPPSLMNLAHLVGLNDYKLKQGFQQVFGTTVFGCLQQQRLEKAKLLLQDSSLNVTAIAQRVGYASPSSFHRAFKKHFGFSPRSRRVS
ncbi:MAG: AraC family transcriptional regulator [Cyanobacteria bacterium P01_A01_bin.68]